MPNRPVDSAALVPHNGLVITRFTEFRGIYERRRAEAFAKHCRTLADLADRAAYVRICPLAPERPWISVQEWEEDGVRKGQWQSDIDAEVLA